jgi:hypothetical protein
MKYCNYCKQPVKGRIDKKFCDDGCRSSFHHQYKSEALKHIKRTNYFLRKNRRIIAHLFEQNQLKISLTELMAEGFDMSYHTRLLEPTPGQKHYECYDYSFFIIENNQVQLHKIC